MRAKLFAEENRKWWTLAAVAFGLFMIMLDNTVVNVALPSMQRSLHLKVSELEWVVAGYALTFGAFMLTGGKLADLLRPAAGCSSSGSSIFTASLARLRARRQRDDPDRRPRRPGARRGADEPGDALDHHGHLPAAAARDGDRDLGRRLGARARDRPARRRGDHRAHQLELDLLHQRPDRRDRDRRRLRVHRRVARHLAPSSARTSPGSPPRRSACSRSSMR